jgi:leucyl-tRNA synthetase
MDFPIEGSDRTLSVFTTRPDTFFGITYLVYAPEHPDVMELVKGTKYEAQAKEFARKVVMEDRFQRTAEDKEKEGMFIGRYAINPFTKERIPIYAANFVLCEYGTGAIIAVPAHDERDFQFAKKYDIPIKVVINPHSFDLDVERMSHAYMGDGTMINSGEFDGLSNRDAIDDITRWLDKNGWGRATTTYKLRDWLISRQRFWGCPIPLIHCEKCGVVPVPEKDLPVVLPDDFQFTQGTGNPLEHCKEFVNTACPKCGGKARRETDTMDTFMDSSWYYLRYLSPHDDKRMFDPELARKWMGVDQYIGGIEHAILHLLYARFICKVLHDFGMVEIEEPFQNLFNQGMITRWSEKSGRIEKMSKSRGNTVSPDELIEEMGADTERVYTLFIGPPEKEAEWSDEAVSGAYRFLTRVWRLLERLPEAPPTAPSDAELERDRHATIQRVTHSFQRFSFNTAVAALMELSNSLTRALEEKTASRLRCEETFDTLLQLLHPMAPHITEELWERRGYTESLLETSWPEHDEAKLRRDRIALVVQVDGKLRDRVEVDAAADEKEVREAVLASPKVQEHLAGREVAKAVLVPGRLINLVTRKPA